MRFEKYINEGVIRDFFTGKLKKITSDKALKFLQKQWTEATKIIRDNGLEEKALKIINKALNTSYKSLDNINKPNMKKMVPEINEISVSLNEDFKHWWEMLKSEGFPALSFYPALTAWLELGNLFDGVSAVDWKKVGVYGLFWALLVSGKYLKTFYKWKKESPEEYYAERPKLAKKHKFTKEVKET